MFLIHTLAADVRAAAPADAVAIARDVSRRRAVAALLPRVVLRFTWRSEATTDSLARDPRSAGDWPVALGATFEIHAVWCFDLRGIPPRWTTHALPDPEEP